MNRQIRFILILLVLTWAVGGQAQDVEQVVKADPWRSSGAITMSNIFTWPKDSLKTDLPYSYYLSGSLNTTFFGVVSVPMSFSYTNNEYASTIAYPFNRFSLAPSYRWIKTYIGYSTMSFSPYTMSGREFMGGGVELTPPDFPLSFSAYYGRFNKAVEFDSTLMQPLYRRMSGGMMIGYKADMFDVSVNAMRSADIENSISPDRSDTNYVAPKGNVALGLTVNAHPFEATTVSVQFATSIIDNNCSKDDSTNLSPSILSKDDDTYRYQAFKVSANQSVSFGSLGVSYEQVSPNYATFSSYYNTDDFRNLTADFAARIGKFANISGSVGYQRDNLENQEVNTNTQAIYNVGLQLAPIERLSLSGSVSNIQSYVYIKDVVEKATETNQYQNLDTLSYTELNFSTNGTASYTFGDPQALSQTISTSYSYQKTSHEQKYSDDFTDTRLHNLNLSYQISHSDSKTTLSLSANFNRTDAAPQKTDVATYSATLSNSFVKNLRASFSATYNTVKSETDYAITNLRATLNYSFLVHHNVNLNYSALTNNSKPGSPQYSLNLTYTYNFSCGIKRTDGKCHWNGDF